MKISDKAADLFLQGYNCAQAVVLAFKDKLNLDEKTLANLSSSFGGGISRLREVCGCVSAMALILGLLYGDYDKLDNESKSKHYQRVQKLAFKFKEQTSSYICSELLSLPSGPSSYIADVRDQHYYLNRPCVKYIKIMADLIEMEINENEQN